MVPLEGKNFTVTGVSLKRTDWHLSQWYEEGEGSWKLGSVGYMELTSQSSFTSICPLTVKSPLTSLSPFIISVPLTLIPHHTSESFLTLVYLSPYTSVTPCPLTLVCYPPYISVTLPLTLVCPPIYIIVTHPYISVTPSPLYISVPPT